MSISISDLDIVVLAARISDIRLRVETNIKFCTALVTARSLLLKDCPESCGMERTTKLMDIGGL